MAESMKGLHRSHRCTEVSSANIGEKVTVMGWVQKRRNLGSLIFIDLRDRSGLLQIVFDEESVGEIHICFVKNYKCIYACNKPACIFGGHSLPCRIAWV